MRVKRNAASRGTGSICLDVEGVQIPISNKQMNRVETDPLVGCSIVCGEYMRANGIFFRVEDQTFLVTARHNVLPTSGENIRSGAISLDFKTEEFRPVIDVYLRSSGKLDVERIDIRDVDGVKQSPEIDVIGIPFDPDPAEYGYHVWEQDDVVSPVRSAEMLDIIGFDGAAFPSSDIEYDVEMYRDEIGRPVMLPVENEMLEQDDLSRAGLMAVAADEEFVGADEDYNGLSGAPVLGNGLMGIHSLNWEPPKEALEETGEDEFMFLIYSRAEILPELLT